mgnify:CR=1 FL=1|tara:strand:+ start:459 stop:641 length:183 start_codon:yes stop_codon:yes gene_type:complete
MSKVIKGKKGFVKLDKDEIKIKRISAYFTDSESKKLLSFAKENKKTVSALIRSRLKDIIE